MKVSGFTFIKNAIIYDYPVVESIRSILPLCDEVVVAVGESDDETEELIRGIDPKKVKIIKTQWDESLREGGKVLAVETNKAFAQVARDSDWAFYIQGDEVLHEKYHEPILEAMEKHKVEKKVEGLLFKYLHFYGSYDYVGTSNNWYKNEIRIVRNDPTVTSFRDAQGFRIGNNRLLNVKSIDAYMYHYGWVKPPEAMQRKQKNFNKLWHDDQWVEKNVMPTDTFDYSANVKELGKFEGTHPQLMEERIAKVNWEFEHDISFKNLTAKDRVKDFIYHNFGLDFSYKNYRMI